MHRSKPKSKGPNPKQPPFNINISFNINPKNVVHHQDNSQMKISHHLYQPSLANPPRTRDGSRKKAKAEGAGMQRSEREGKRSWEDSSEVESISKKRMDKIKKSFLNKINDFDIDIPPPPSDAQPLICEADVNRSSIMSAKLPQFPPEHSHPDSELA